MKNIFNKNYKATIIILLVSLTASFFGCSGEDAQLSSNNFLEINNGVKWKSLEDEDRDGVDDRTTYIIFKNNVNIPFEWRRSTYEGPDSTVCYNDNNSFLFSDYTEILENTKDSFIVRTTSTISCGTHISNWAFTKSGESIRLLRNGIECSSPWNNPVEIYNKTSDNVENLKICN